MPNINNPEENGRRGYLEKAVGRCASSTCQEGELEFEITADGKLTFPNVRLFATGAEDVLDAILTIPVKEYDEAASYASSHSELQVPANGESVVFPNKNGETVLTWTNSEGTIEVTSPFAPGNTEKLRIDEAEQWLRSPFSSETLRIENSEEIEALLTETQSGVSC